MGVEHVEMCLAPCIALGKVMEAIGTPETSLNCQITRRNTPEDSHLYTRRRVNLKSEQKCRFHEDSFFFVNYYFFFGSEGDVTFRKQSVTFFKYQQMAPVPWVTIQKRYHFVHRTMTPTHGTGCSNNRQPLKETLNLAQ
jgi:hypothetical protein